RKHEKPFKVGRWHVALSVANRYSESPIKRGHRPRGYLIYHVTDGVRLTVIIDKRAELDFEDRGLTVVVNRNNDAPNMTISDPLWQNSRCYEPCLRRVLIRFITAPSPNLVHEQRKGDGKTERADD